MNDAIRLLSCAVVAALALSRAARADDFAERVDFYLDGGVRGHQVSVWNQAHATRRGGGTEDGKHLWLNDDWKARPWSGMNVKGGAGTTLTKEWIEKGFVRFLVNATVTRYGQPAGFFKLQVQLDGTGGKYQQMRSAHVDRGRGRDEDAASWQEVLIPLAYYTYLEPRMTVTGISIQNYRQPELAFGLDEIGLVRYAELPAWFLANRSVDVIQRDVRWPAYDELPASLKADRAPPRVVNGRFVAPDGTRVFLINPYTREDQRLVMWGGNDASKRVPDHGLYDPKVHGWLYSDLLTAESLCRLGFNSLSVTMPPKPWYDRLGFDKRDHADPALLPQLRDRVKVPFFVDCVCWPWTLGAPALKGGIPAEAVTQGRHHWTPYRITGLGREMWLEMWKLYAKRYVDAGANAVMLELMNEPAYLPTSADHRDEFEAWLRKRYRSVDEVNGRWKTTFASWAEAATYQTDGYRSRIVNQALDYDEYLAGRFADLVEAGVEAVTAISPDTLVGLQPMGGYAMRPRESIWKHLIARHETGVLTPTGGGSWTRGSGARTRTKDVVSTPMAGGPIENDLLLALAGTKMIVDNETYLSGQTRASTANRLWKHVICGLDGATVFAWSKRGWAWHKGREALETEADKYPYSALIPIARRTDALRGIHDFSNAIQPIADLILPKPWGPRPKIAFVYDWDDVRRRVHEPDRLDKRGAYYNALKYAHWNMAVVPSDAVLDRGGLDGYDVAVLAAVANVEPELPRALVRFVETGGVLVVGEELFDRDIYGRPVDTLGLIGCESAPAADAKPAAVRIPDEFAPPAIDGDVVPRRPGRTVTALREGTRAVVTDATGVPVVTRRALGRGYVYYQAADVIGYPLAKILWVALADAARQTGTRGGVDAWRAADIVDAATGKLATNVLLSRRSYPERGHHALLLMNMDDFAKRIRLRVPLAGGTWTAKEHITNTVLQNGYRVTFSGRDVATRGVTLAVDAGAAAVVILRAVK